MYCSAWYTGGAQETLNVVVVIIIIIIIIFVIITIIIKTIIVLRGLLATKILQKFFSLP